MNNNFVVSEDTKLFGIWFVDDESRSGNWMCDTNGLVIWSFHKGLMAGYLRRMESMATLYGVSSNRRVAVIGDDGLPQEEGRAASA
jgi:hypothetical protein